ncbi:MAG: RnfABCDGE type electron transport complex subunit B [Acetivibrio sp.]
MNGILLAALVISVTGLAIGLVLGIAGKKFAVEVDERVTFVRDELPGNNCGGCGYAGCDALAEAIVKGEAPVNACPVGGAPVAQAVGKIMGTDAKPGEKKVAFVKCNGTCDKTTIKYNYYGIQDCKKMALIPGEGNKGCDYGCLGYGSCVRACAFDAIHIINGVAVVDKEKCVSCGKCVTECPKHLIELLPYDAKHIVQCSSHGKGKDVKAVCEVGCIGCGICVKQCEAGAISVENNIAYIDQSKCTKCGKCAEKCPVHIIVG